MTWSELCYWNSRTYGSAIQISRECIVGFFIFLCLVTPATNWMIPVINKAVSSGIKIRRS